ncbi:MAG: hypothetical protein GY867_12030 [bacterium]|nr:hypothetical protein [bacterium]
MLLRNLIKNNLVWSLAGSVCLTTSLLLWRFGPQYPTMNFLQGMLLGLSLVFNITFLILWGKARRTA